LEADLALLEQTNNPAVTWVSDEDWAAQQAMLDRVAKLSYLDEKGQNQPVLSAEDKYALEVRRGSLTPDEYRQIQDHAQLSFEFLRQIPWIGTLEDIPAIAHAHHERNDGSGYPLGLKENDIPFAARIMAIADVYDALTAADRPYKRAMEPERALKILREDAEAGKLDPEMLDIFIKRGIYKLTADWHPGGSIIG
jgi:hypothetical protein